MIVSPYIRKGTMVRVDRALYGLGVLLVFHDDEDRRLWLDHPERWDGHRKWCGVVSSVIEPGV